MRYPIYEFYYPDRDIRQQKALIPHSVYEEYKRTYDQQGEDAAKAFLKSHIGNYDYFTDKSSMYDATQTGIIIANGRHRCIATKVD